LPIRTDNFHESATFLSATTSVSDFQVAITSLRLLGVLGALYAFLFGLDLMGMAFKVDREFGG